MKDYEHKRENLWKDAYCNDPAFPHGESPTAKVISFFCKRGSNDPEVNINPPLREEYSPEYCIQVDTSWFKTNLNRVFRTKTKWYGEQDIYNFIVLQNYLEQLVAGKYKQCILSKREWAAVAPKKKKNAVKSGFR